jgi:hypothetical protein
MATILQCAATRIVRNSYDHYGSTPSATGCVATKSSATTDRLSMSKYGTMYSYFKFNKNL